VTVSHPGVADPLDRSEAISIDDGFVAVGDILLGDTPTCVGFGFHSRYPRDASPAFSSLAPLLKRGEIVIGNLESVLARAGLGATRYQADEMRGDPEYASNLRLAGFTAMSIANNHAMQHGIAGFESTVRCLETAGIKCVGLRGNNAWCAEPVVQTTRNGLRVGMLGYSWRPRQYDPGDPPYAEGDVEAVVRDVARLRLSTDAVVVSLHWGDEFLNLPSVAEVAAARRIIDAGASVIVGHHPHVVRPVERYRDGVICYSLGNFVSDMIWQPALRSGAVMECRLSRGSVSDIGISAIRVDDAFRAERDTLPVQRGTDPIRGLAEADYRAQVARSVRRQRFAAYAYAARNIGRYPPAVLGQLVARTLRNKIHGVIAAGFDRSANGTPNEAERQKSEGTRGALSILHVVAPARFGGLESVVRLLAAGQLRRGHSVRVAAVLSDLNDSPHPFVQALGDEGIPTITFRLSDRDYRGERKAIRSLCRQDRPDIVHTHGFRSDAVNGTVASAEGIAVVSTCHGFIDSHWRGRFYQWLQRRALRRFDAAIAVSTSVEARLRAANIPAAKIHLVPNCFSQPGLLLTREEARRKLHLPEGPVIGWVGRLTSEKGADVALEAFARLKHPDTRLVIIGEGRDEEALRSRAMRLGMSERVHWCGAIPSAGELFPAFDVFLLSSRSEGTPIALFEAMAANVPIVATRVGGVPDVVDPSSAQLVDSEDPAAMAAALAEVFAHPDLARVRAARAKRRLVDRFDPEQWLARYESIYRAVARPPAMHPAG
jgi:poly-gamma-glutamate synthesis protein (capsule biosynthesis protein)